MNSLKATALEPTNEPLLWGDKRFHTWNYEMREQFGGKVFKVMLDAGFTCPNRDGRSRLAAVRSAAREDRAISPDSRGTIWSRNSIRSAICSIKKWPTPSISAISRPIRILMRR